MTKKAAIVSLSGGLDSAVLLGKLLEGTEFSYKPEEVLAVSFTYGSKHNVYELRAARALAGHYRVQHHCVRLEMVMGDFKSALMLSSEHSVPQGHYEEDTMRQTVVPGRNLIFLSILAGLAESMETSSIYIGAHAGDHFIYPDCRPEFLTAAREAIYQSSDGKVSVYSPFSNLKKVDIVKLGAELDVPFHLTRTCYAAQNTACGKCGSCQERLEAFHLNNLTDPIPYESTELLPKTN